MISKRKKIEQLEEIRSYFMNFDKRIEKLIEAVDEDNYINDLKKFIYDFNCNSFYYISGEKFIEAMEALLENAQGLPDTIPN